MLITNIQATVKEVLYFAQMPYPSVSEKKKTKAYKPFGPLFGPHFYLGPFVREIKGKGAGKYAPWLGVGQRKDYLMKHRYS